LTQTWSSRKFYGNSRNSIGYRVGALKIGYSSQLLPGGHERCRISCSFGATKTCKSYDMSDMSHAGGNWMKLASAISKIFRYISIYLNMWTLHFLTFFFTYFYMMSLNLSSACALRVLWMCSGVATCITKPAGSRRRWAFDIFNLAHLVAFLETKVASQIWVSLSPYFYVRYIWHLMCTRYFYCPSWLLCQTLFFTYPSSSHFRPGCIRIVHGILVIRKRGSAFEQIWTIRVALHKQKSTLWC
jgi:hypothetical protein